MLLDLAQETGERVLNQNLVTAASIALIAASVLWVVLSRLILRNLRKSQRPTPVEKPVRDPWRAPPIRRRR
jgi:hypothetical protein